MPAGIYLLMYTQPPDVEHPSITYFTDRIAMQMKQAMIAIAKNTVSYVLK